MAIRHLEEKYESVARQLGISGEDSQTQANRIIRESLHKFVSGCRMPAVWCYGKHTKMLMADFIFEMKGVRLIIDETFKGSEEGGFSIIGRDMISSCGIDGIVISSFKYREEIKKALKDEHGGIKYLDIYDELEKNGIRMLNEYYATSHPYARYLMINECRRVLGGAAAREEKREAFLSLLKEYVKIKDFRSAILCAERYGSIYGLDPQLAGELKELCAMQLEAVSGISDKNVLMLCIDGLRMKDIIGNAGSRTGRLLEDGAYVFRNAYSFSTSTFESLVPAYSGNDDLRTGYFEKNAVEEDECRFIQAAINQGRKVFFYTDSTPFVRSDKICVTDSTQTATEKIWDFTLDASGEDNGLFYIHVLYESHYSYPNPYTEGKIITEGTNIMFDFLPKNGGKIRTDYRAQHDDAVSYIDDVLHPFLSALKARMVLYADHGNILIPPDGRLEDVTYEQDTFHEDLVRIPLIIRSPEMGTGSDSRLISLMSINDIVISLLRKEKYEPCGNGFIKIARSEIYNPDFRYLYKKNGHERGLMAFEGFIFEEGCKLIVYSDGTSELYETENDRKIDDETRKERLLDMVRSFVTVTGFRQREETH